MTSSDRKTLKKGTKVGGYVIRRCIGQGGYGDVYEARGPNGDPVALKVEEVRAKKQALSIEQEFMQQLHDSPYFPRMFEYGEDRGYRFLAMELLGPSLTAIRRSIKSEQFSLSTTLRMGIEMLRTIRAFHELGFVHRDVKPSQMLVRASASHPIALIDFGLSKSFMDMRTGTVLPKKEHAGFVGTAKYASMNAHRKKDQGRRDDLFGWFYSMVELRTGCLPWPGGPDRESVLKVMANVSVRRLCAGLPLQFRQIYGIIQSLKFADEPPYDVLTAILVQCMMERRCLWSDPYEWLQLSHKKLKQITVVSLVPREGSEPIVPENLPEPPPIEEIQNENEEESSSTEQGGCTDGCILL